MKKLIAIAVVAVLLLVTAIIAPAAASTSTDVSNNMQPNGLPGDDYIKVSQRCHGGG